MAGEQATLGVVWSRPLPSAPSSVTVYQDRAGRWWASFVVTLELPEAPLGPTGRCSGLDMGLTTFATAEDDAHDVANPGLARRAAKTLARSQANMARKLKISNHRAKARQQLARASAQVAHQRAGFHHKAARGLLGAYDVIGVEALVVKKMSRRAKPRHRRRKAGLNRSIADAGWAQFLAVLQWQAVKAGKKAMVLPAPYTTQTCSNCGREPSPASGCRTGCSGAPAVGSSSGGTPTRPRTWAEPWAWPAGLYRPGVTQKAVTAVSPWCLRALRQSEP